MTDFATKVFRSLMTSDQLARFEGNEKNYAEDCARFAAMTDAQLAETVAYYVTQCSPPKWSRGEPVYDGVVWHNLIPEMIRRLRKEDK